MSRTELHNIDVDRVVREVLARLAAAPSEKGSCGCQGEGAAKHGNSSSNLSSDGAAHGGCRCAEKSSSRVASADAAVPPQIAAQQLILSGNVLTVRDLEGRLSGVRTVQVALKTIVTPAAADLLREAGVTLLRGAAANAAGSATPASHRLLLATAQTKYCTDALTKDLRRAGVDVTRIPRGSLAEAVSAVAAQVSAERLSALVVSDEPYAAACLANRRAAVRAAVVQTADDARRAIAAIGANVLVVDPRRCGAAELRRVARELALTGGASCPASLAAALS